MNTFLIHSKFRSIFGISLLITGILFSMSFNSCKHDELDISKYPDVCFENDVKPIFVSNCALSGCHSASGGEAGLVLDNYNGIMQGISPGSPLKSEIYSVITNEWINMMPPDNPLTQSQRTLIRLWIEQGALNEPCSE